MLGRLAPGARNKQMAFFAAWILSWLVVAAFYLGVFKSIGTPLPFPRNMDFRFWLLAQLTYALLQPLLMRRFLDLEPHRWRLWTLLGMTVGILCDSLWHDFLAQTGLSESAESNLMYRIADYLFMFGIPAVFQYFSLPMHLSRRWYWLLAALPGLALIAADSSMYGFALLLSVVLQAIAVQRIAARRLLKRPAADKEPAKQKA